MLSVSALQVYLLHYILKTASNLIAGLGDLGKVPIFLFPYS